MKCPRCKTGLMVPDTSYDVPALHYLNCGDLFLKERPVVMPEIPSAQSPLSQSSHAVACREYRARKGGNRYGTWIKTTKEESYA